VPCSTLPPYINSQGQSQPTDVGSDDFLSKLEQLVLTRLGVKRPTDAVKKVIKETRDQELNRTLLNLHGDFENTQGHLNANSSFRGSGRNEADHLDFDTYDHNDGYDGYDHYNGFNDNRNGAAAVAAVAAAAPAAAAVAAAAPAAAVAVAAAAAAVAAGDGSSSDSGEDEGKLPTGPTICFLSIVNVVLVSYLLSLAWLLAG
jgi:hypothetical protein